MKHIAFYAECECGWKSGAQASCAKVQKAVKAHLDNNPHRDFEDVPMF